MSLSAPPLCLIVLPKEVNPSVAGRSSPFTLTAGGLETFSIITLVFF